MIVLRCSSYAALIEEGVTAKPDVITLRELPEQRVRRCALENHGVKTKNTERLRHAHGEIRQSGNPGCPLGYAYGEFFDLLEQPEQPVQPVSYALWRCGDKRPSRAVVLPMS